jgi:hypothetical protein
MAAPRAFCRGAVSRATRLAHKMDTLYSEQCSVAMALLPALCLSRLNIPWLFGAVFC